MNPTSEALKAAKAVKEHLAATETSGFLGSTVTGSTEQIEQRIATIIDESTGLPELLEHFHRPVPR